MKTIIVDCNCIGYMAKYAMGQLSYDKVATGTIYGFLKIVLALSQQFDTNRFWFCWDSQKSVRRCKHKFYKANRNENKSPRDQELDSIARQQFRQLRTEILPRIGFKNIFMQVGHESDDLMMKLVQDNWEECRTDLVVVTTDHDLYQVLQLCPIYDPRNKVMYTAQAFWAEYEIAPVSWAYVKAIAGCPTDNVPGVEGVGEHTAIKFITNRMKEQSKRYKAIKASAGIIDRNKWLVTLPLSSTRKMKIVDDELDMREFLRVCRDYGLNSFRRGPGYDSWCDLIEGYE